MAEACACAVGQNVFGSAAGKLLGWILNRTVNPLIKCNENVKNREKKFEGLTNRRERVQHDVQEAEMKEEEIEKEVKTWMSEVDNYIGGEAKEIWDALQHKANESCFIGLCRNPKSLYRLSKKAAEDAQAADRLLLQADKFRRISFFQDVKVEQAAVVVEDSEKFDSRMRILKSIMEDLQSPSINIVGVHGMPGVGKTTLVKEIKRMCKQDKLFDAVAMAFVGQKPDWKAIQDEIAHGLELELRTDFSRWTVAQRIKARLRKKKVLLIFDDIWKPVLENLEELGIPFKEEQKECKILLVSRDRDVLSGGNGMGSQKDFTVGQLAVEEAWELFKKMAGDVVESQDVQPIARRIVEKCGGLPLAIATIGRALMDKKDLFHWEYALQELERPSQANFNGISSVVYSAIKVSYSHLKSEDLKNIFLLCGLMMHGSTIQYLLIYCIGLGLFDFDGITNVEAARNKVLVLISELKASSLLVDDTSLGLHFRMHDLVRDVARSIAFTERNLLSLIDEDMPTYWLKGEAFKKCEWIDLWHPEMSELPDVSECPQLTFFHWSNKAAAAGPSLAIPADFFKGMPKLRVLNLTRMHLPALPSSIGLFTSLYTLCLDQCRLEDISIIKELKNLLVLELRGSHLEKLPEEIGQLIRLQVLDLSDCRELKVVPPNVLARLSRLEELYMRNSFDQWEFGQNEDQTNANLSELEHLKKLVALEVCIGNVQMIQNRKDLFCTQLKRYKIFIGDVWNGSCDLFPESSTRVLKLKLNAEISYDHSIRTLLKMVEELHLEELKDVKDVLYQFSYDDFDKLKYLTVQNSADAQYVINSQSQLPSRNAFPLLEVLVLSNLVNLVKICHGRSGEMSLRSLKKMTVVYCNQLKNLFSFSETRRQLVKLQEITVTDCNSIEEIIGDDAQLGVNEIEELVPGAVQHEASETIRLDQVSVLTLQHLPNLISFLRDKDNSCTALFNEKVKFPNLKVLQLSWININAVWHPRLSAESYRVENLTKLIIEGCHNLEYLFSPSMARCLLKLSHLEIIQCKRMKEVIFTENMEEYSGSISFPRLSFLAIRDLENLVGFCAGNCILEFPCLMQLGITSCPLMKEFNVQRSTRTTCDIQSLFNDQVAFPSLERLFIDRMSSLKMIWHKQLHADSFCKLKDLIVLYCENLMEMLPYYMLSRVWKSLEKLCIRGCGALELVFEFGNGVTNGVTNTHLRKLFIGFLPKLKHVWDKDPQGSLSFQELESVKIISCLSLKNVFPASVAKTLCQLQTLSITGCGVEEIVSVGVEANAEAEHKFVFPRVFKLKFEDLPRLKHFYPGKHSSEWPMLKKFVFGDVLSVKKSNGKGQTEFNFQPPLICAEKVIPQLENVSFSLNDMKIICECQSREGIYSNVKVLKIHGYDNESDGLPINFLQKLCNLQELVVQNTNFEELLPSNEDAEHMEIHSRIKTLKLLYLGLLAHIRRKDSFPNLETLVVKRCNSLITFAADTESFHNLTTLIVWDCPELSNFFSYSTAQSLAQLKEMTIGKCKKLTEIVGKEEDGAEDLVIIFEKLRYLRIFCLTRLASFCSGNFSFEFPLLEQVVVEQCPKLITFSGGSVKTPLLKGVQLVDFEEDKCRWLGDLNRTIQQMYADKVGYSRLEYLSLSEFPELMELWHTRRVQETLDFRQLYYLEITDCDISGYLLTPSMVFTLGRLTSLTIKNCTVIEQVIMTEEAAENQIMFPMLHVLSIESCPKMTSFYKGSGSLQCPALINLIIRDCQRMVTFASSISAKASPFLFSDEVEFPQLQNLTLSSSFNGEQIWHDQVNKTQNLQLLAVSGCDNLKFLGTSSMVKSLECLRILSVSECKSLEAVIVTDELENGERMLEMFFPKLLAMTLKDLPMFTRFCSGKFVEFPEIRELSIVSCPVLETFIGDMTSTSSLFDAKVALPRLDVLDLQDLKGLERIWDEHLDADSFGELRAFTVHHCENLESIFPVNMLARLQKVEQLVISDCDSLETIFENSSTWTSNIVFQELTDLELCSLVKLKDTYPQVRAIECPSLTKLKVVNCPVLEVLALEFPNLQITNGDDQLLHPLFWITKESFPRLEELELGYNSFMQGIWNGDKPEDYFPKLKVFEFNSISESQFLNHLCGHPEEEQSLIIEVFRNSVSVFYFFLQSSLEKLVVNNGLIIEEIFQCGSAEIPPSGLNELRLFRLNQLMHLWNEESELEPVFHSLRILEVVGCGRLINLVPSVVSFENLQTLQVSGCHGLVNLVTYPTAKSLVQLTTMTISDCHLIEQVVAACVDDEVNDGIVFNNLKHLRLSGLPGLTSFCHLIKCNFEFPCLEEVIVIDCPSMQIFSTGELKTPKLQQVIVSEEGDQGCWTDNLNSTIQFMAKFQVGEDSVEATASCSRVNQGGNSDSEEDTMAG